MYIVMCRPDFFDVTYELDTNRWMDVDNPPDRELSIRQWTNLLNNYRKYGIDVYIMPGQKNMSDMVFSANAGMPFNGHFITSNFFHRERALEVPFINEYFYKKFNLHELPAQFTFEGQGDVVAYGKKSFLVGCGIRTSRRAVNFISTRILPRIDRNASISPINLRHKDDYDSGEHMFYHLDTCLLYLSRINTFVVYPRAFENGEIDSLKNLGNVFCLNREEAETFACNSVVVSDDVIYTPELKHKRVRRFFTDHGYVPVEHDMSEFMKSGGAVKCLSLEVV